MSPAVARTSPALAGRRRSSNRQARCKLFFEPRRHSAFWGGYPMSDEEARPRGWAGGPRALPCERLGQGSNPASLVPKLLPLEHRFRDHTSGQGPVGELLHRLDGLPGHEAAEEQRVFLKTECASAIPFTDSWGAPPPPGLQQKLAGRGRQVQRKEMGALCRRTPKTRASKAFRDHRSEERTHRDQHKLLEAPGLPAILSVWPSYPQVPYRTLGLAGPRPAKRRFLNAFQARKERKRSKEIEGNQLLFLPLGDALQRAPRLVLTVGSSGLLSPAPPI